MKQGQGSAGWTAACLFFNAALKQNKNNNNNLPPSFGPAGYIARHQTGKKQDFAARILQSTPMVVFLGSSLDIARYKLAPTWHENSLFISPYYIFSRKIT